MKRLCFKRMKRRLCGALAVVCLMALLGASMSVAAYEPPADIQKKITAKAAIVVYLEGAATAEEGVKGKDTVVYEKNGDMKLSPAAMNRVMVGLYAEKLIKDKKIDVAKTTGTYTMNLQEQYVLGTGLALVNMEVGDTWTVEDLLRVSMIQTAADACVTLASTLAGSVESFVAGMNEMAKSIGCTNTTFTNVHGLDAPQQKTTVRDMYTMLRYAMEDARLSEMLSASECTVNPVNGAEQSWENSNYMLRATSDYYYTPVVLGKTGVSEDSGRAVASVAQRDGTRYLTVVMGCPEENEDGETGTHYDNSIELYEWAFGAFDYQTIVPANQPMRRVRLKLSWSADSVAVISREALNCVVPADLDVTTLKTDIRMKEETLIAPVDRNTVVGTAVISLPDGTEIGRVDLVAGESLPRSVLLAILDGIGSVLGSPWLWIGVGVFILLVIGYIALAVAQNRNRRSGHKR